MPKVVGYVECRDKKTGRIYFKGEDGTICVPGPDPNDTRPSSWTRIGKVTEDISTQSSIGDFL